MEIYETMLENIKKALFSNDSTLFAASLNAILDAYDKAMEYVGHRRTWTLMVGYHSCWSPTLERTVYGNIHKSNWEDGYYAYENTSKVLKEGEDILAGMDRAVRWEKGFNSMMCRWDYPDAKVELQISSFYHLTKDELSMTLSVNTGQNCKAAFFTALELHIKEAIKILARIQESRKVFDGTKYGFNKPVTDYMTWVAKYVPVILRNNGYDEKSYKYDGINIRPAECTFWTGKLQKCTSNGILFGIGGPSSDAENWIPYEEWNSHRDYYWYSEHAEAGARLYVDHREEMSKKIFEYIKTLCRDGKLK